MTTVAAIQSGRSLLRTVIPRPLPSRCATREANVLVGNAVRRTPERFVRDLTPAVVSQGTWADNQEWMAVMRYDMEGDDVVEAALARLPARDREAVELAAWEELTLPQIARVMGCSHDALRLRLNSAHHRFARALADLDAS